MNGTAVLNKSNDQLNHKKQNKNNFEYYDQKMKNFDISEPRRRTKYSKVLELNNDSENPEARQHKKQLG